MLQPAAVLLQFEIKVLLESVHGQHCTLCWHHFSSLHITLLQHCCCCCCCCCTPSQFEIKAFLESVHGMQVERVSTINYQGKKQRIIDSKGRAHYR
jgi:hypothetical protein